MKKEIALKGKLKRYYLHHRINLRDNLTNFIKSITFNYSKLKKSIAISILQTSAMCASNIASNIYSLIIYVMYRVFD